MNVLLFTTSMILLLSALTYARLETYRSFSILQGQFNHYMAVTERGTINSRAEKWYNDSQGSRSGRTPQLQPQGKRQSLSRLSFIVFVDSKKQEAYAQEFPQLLNLAKKLIIYLYKDTAFFQRLEQRRPDFVSALLSSLMIAENLPKAQKLKRAADLANLNLQDPDLNDAFYLILQGTLKPSSPRGEELFNKGPPCQLPAESSQEEEGGIEIGQLEEVKSPQGYYSLLDYITLQDAAKVRVYLASRPLLMAIFDDPAVVSSFLETRCHLYRNVMHDALTPEQASQNLRSQFLPQSKGFDETILDFSVTKTNPSDYE